MTTYFEAVASDSGKALAWDDPTIWNQGSVPDTTNDGVILNQLGAAYTVTVKAAETYSIASLQVSGNNTLILDGSLTSAANVNVNITGGEILLDGGSLSAGHIVVGGAGLYGIGSVTSSGSLEDQAHIVSQITPATPSGQTTLTVSAASFYNSGLLEAGAGTTLLVETSQTNGFVNFTLDPTTNVGTLTGGTYQVDANATLDLKTDGEIGTLDATLIINTNYPGMVNSYSGGQFYNLETSLDRIGPSGALIIRPGMEFALEYLLTVDGKVQIGQNGILGAREVVVDHGGSITYSGNSATAGIDTDVPYLTDNGTITAQAAAGTSTSLALPNILGNGSVVIGPAVGNATVSVSLLGSDSADIVFSDNRGTATLGAPTQVTGTFHGFAQGDTILLQGVNYASVTDYSYSGSGTAGTLTIDEGGTAIRLAFAGDYATHDFSLSSAGTSGSPEVAIHLVGVATG